MGGVRNGATKDNWCWDLNPGVATIRDWDHMALVRDRTHSFEVLPFTMWIRKQERLCLEEKGLKDSYWWAMRRCHMVLD